MLAAILTFLVMGVLAIAAVGIVLAVVGSILGLAVGLGVFLLFKVLPVMLIGYAVVRLLSPKQKALSAEDRKWLES